MHIYLIDYMHIELIIFHIIININFIYIINIIYCIKISNNILVVILTLYINIIYVDYSKIVSTIL